MKNTIPVMDREVTIFKEIGIMSAKVYKKRVIRVTGNRFRAIRSLLRNDKQQKLIISSNDPHFIEVIEHFMEWGGNEVLHIAGCGGYNADELKEYINHLLENQSENAHCCMLIQRLDKE